MDSIITYKAFIMTFPIIIKMCKNLNEEYEVGEGDDKILLNSTLNIYYNFLIKSKDLMYDDLTVIGLTCYWLSFKFHMDETFDIFSKELAPCKWRKLIFFEGKIMKTFHYELCQYI